MANTPNNLLLLFQKPNEPVFAQKDDGKTIIELPEEYYTDRYRPLGDELSTRFGEDVTNKVVLKAVAKLPDLSFALALSKEAGFSLFNQAHKEMASKLMQIFMDQPDAETLMSVAAYCKDRVNAYLFQYALSVAMQHRDDTKNIELPSIVSTFPDKFVDPSAFPKAREEATLVAEENRQHINIPMEFTSNNKEVEQKLAYFREDIGVNMHHWHWHLVYPGEGPDQIVRKDRRGELFYYMHNQVIARYNVDRICARLEKAKPLTNIRSIIPEAYFPKIIRSKLNRAYPPRVANMTLQDVNRTDAVVEVADIERWRDRIYNAIDQGQVIDSKGKAISLNGLQGIDILGDIVESSALSPNKLVYGDLHNQGHNLISFVHDPEQKYLEEFGVMGDVTTAMRDPIFYRWHSFIDTVFQRHKKLQPSYVANTELAYAGVTVSSVNVQITQGKNTRPNTLLTFWQKSDVDLSTGLDFGPEGNVYASFTHLQHAPFAYTITVENKASAQKIGTCRIFMCPINDDRGQPITKFEEQRSLMIEMDKFTVYLNPGQNTIRRRSDESSINDSLRKIIP
ncbi:hypothetical protein HA402_000981 [Bradysia odoriphaga]|nr:hypothetical protein HA402_000981 [Bradysia odoriphaga]